jgi:hypothetical protein
VSAPPDWGRPLFATEVVSFTGAVMLTIFSPHISQAVKIALPKNPRAVATRHLSLPNHVRRNPNNLKKCPVAKRRAKGFNDNDEFNRARLIPQQ